MMRDLDRFITSNPDKAPPMTVKVIDHNGQVSDVYEAPAGFQMDRYVKSLYPQARVMVSYTHMELTISAFIPGDDDVFEIHHGVYHDRIF